MIALVTGGGGFLGSAITRLLLERGDTVRIFQRGDAPELVAEGAEQVRGDLCDRDAVLAAAEGCDTIFHVAALAGVWGPEQRYFEINVGGTGNVLAACLERGVRRLIHTSTPSVAFTGFDEVGVDESVGYSERFLCAYPHSKADAEKQVLAFNGQDDIATVALRPHLIWGPGDNHLVPRVLDRGRQGKLRLVGGGENLVDTTYVENAAQAHVCAADALTSPKSACAGKPYFISNGEPKPMREILNRILAAGGQEPVTRSVPPWLAYAVGAAMECAYRLRGCEQEPPMTRFVARQLSTAHWFDISAARRDLGYAPTITLDEGFQRLGQYLQTDPYSNAS